MANLTKDVMTKANGPTHESRNEYEMKESIGDFATKIGEVAKNVSDETKDYVKMSSRYVKENPEKGVAIAAAAGVVLGSLLTLIFRRRPRSHSQER